jgi:toxin FitB
MFEVDFAGRILGFDSAAAREFADIAATRRHVGRPIAQADAQIAAIVRSRGAALATRNSADFTQCGISVVNPWEA